MANAKGYGYRQNLLEAGKWDEFYKLLSPNKSNEKVYKKISRSPSNEIEPQTHIALLPKQLQMKTHLFLNNESASQPTIRFEEYALAPSSSRKTL